MTRTTIVGLNYVPEPTGIAPYTAGLASGLVAEGESVRVVTSYPHYPAWEIAEGYEGPRISENIDGVPVARVRPYVTKNPSGVKRLLLEIHFGVRASLTPWGRPDVVILVSPALFSTAIIQFRALMTPRRPSIIVWVQDIYSLGVAETGALGSRGTDLIKRLERHVLRKADRVVVIHDRFKRVLVSSLDVRAGAIKVVRNWTHLKPVRVDRKLYRSKFGWGSEIVVLHAGNMGAKQALENVVEAARLGDLRSSNVRFVLLGNGNQRDALEVLAEGVTRLDFMNSLNEEDFQGAMAAADILLVNEKPGVTEMAVPSKLTSYFSAQRPVIVATDAGSITAEEIETAGAGVRVNAGDPAALLQASLELGSDRARADEYGRNGALFQSEVLSASGAVAGYAEIISSLAGKRGH